MVGLLRPVKNARFEPVSEGSPRKSLGAPLSFVLLRNSCQTRASIARPDPFWRLEPHYHTFFAMTSSASIAERLAGQLGDRYREVHRLKENIGAANVELTASDLRKIEEATSRITVHGERYPPHLMERVGR